MKLLLELFECRFVGLGANLNFSARQISRIAFDAKALGNAQREMVVYTPPGYEKGTASYPVLYLIHGGGDTAVSS